MAVRRFSSMVMKWLPVFVLGFVIVNGWRSVRFTSDFSHVWGYLNIEDKAAVNNGPLPDWRIITDCSIYSADCVTRGQIMKRYKKYPFEFAKESYAKYKWENLETLPVEWEQSLEEHTPNDNETIDMNDYYVYPPERSESEVRACITTAEKKSLNEQLDIVLSHISRAPDINMVSFTISDYKYAFDMIHEVFEMAWDTVGFEDAFFMVALDRETLELACLHGYPVIAGPGALGEDDSIKSKVANTKFEVSYQLVKSGYSFFFFEMDVFFLQSPKPWLFNQTADLIISSHQNNPGGPNIGVFSVLANDASRQYFRLCLEWTKLGPSIHDQKVMSMVWWTSEHVKRGANATFLYNADWDVMPEVPSFKRHFKVDLFGPHEVVADVHPIPTENTIAIHPLCDAPLKSPHGKKFLVKELGAWYGFRGPAGAGGYYHRTNENRRYLWLDGRPLGGYSTVMESSEDPWGFYHREDVLRLTIAVLVALARRTKRILVLPKIVRDRGAMFLWTDLDLQSLEGLVEVRETNFLSNPKSWYCPEVPFQTVSRLALGRDERLFAQLPFDAEVRSWKLTNIMDAVDALFAISTALPEITESEALLVNPYFVQGGYFGEFFRRSTGTKLSMAENEILGIYEKLRWCNIDKIELDRIAPFTRSVWDCYAEGVPVYP